MAIRRVGHPWRLFDRRGDGTRADWVTCRRAWLPGFRIMEGCVILLVRSISWEYHPESLSEHEEFLE